MIYVYVYNVQCTTYMYTTYNVRTYIYIYIYIYIHIYIQTSYDVQCTRTYDVQSTYIISYNEHHLVIITYKCKINIDLYYAHKFTLLFNYIIKLFLWFVNEYRYNNWDDIINGQCITKAPVCSPII